jgi:hypothetical protein
MLTRGSFSCTAQVADSMPNTHTLYAIALVSRTLRECGHQYVVHAVTHACRVHAQHVQLHVLSGMQIGCATHGPELNLGELQSHPFVVDQTLASKK